MKMHLSGDLQVANQRRRRRRPTATAPAGPRAALAMMLVLCPVLARAGVPVQADSSLEARVGSLIRASVDEAYAGRLDRALQVLDEAQALAPRDPRIGVARYARFFENFPFGVFEKERARAQAAPLVSELTRVIGICDSILSVDENNKAAFLYRGWAYLNRSQTYVIMRNTRPAIGDARRGKSDLDKFYALHGQADPDAATLLGGYLYFADTLPGFFKFLGWLIGVPGGDREKGLGLLEEGATGNGLAHKDAGIVLAVTRLVFDGDIERAAVFIDERVREYPLHPWGVEYYCLLAFFYPERTAAAIEAINRALDGWGDTVRGWEEPAHLRLLWMRARLYRQAGRYDDALADLDRIMESTSPWPHYVPPSAHVAAIEIEGELGRWDAQERWCARIPKEDERYDERRDELSRACARTKDSTAAAVFVELGRVREMLYRGDLAEAERLLVQAETAHGSNAGTNYLRGELARQSGRNEDALESFERAAAMAEKAGSKGLRLQALLGLGEIYLSRGDFSSAKRRYQKAEEIEPENTTLGAAIRARLRHIERIGD